jgi:hypothetical protein
MISPTLALSFRLAGLAPELPPNEPVATGATQPTKAEPDASTETPTVPEAPPPPIAGTATITPVGALDPDVPAAAVDRAPPPEPVEVAETTAAPPNPALAFGRGPYLDLALGSISAFAEGMPLGIAAAIGGGFLFAPRRAPRFRAAVGVHAANHMKLGLEGPGLAFATARLGLGAATPRLLAMAHLGVGPGIQYEFGGHFGSGFDLPGIASLSGSLRGRVSKRVALGVEAGTLVVFEDWSPDAIAQLYGLLHATWIWDAPRRKESGR